MAIKPAPAGHIREATLDDIAALIDIEEHSFQSDRLSARSFRHLLTKGNSVTLVDDVDGALRGYITLLFRKAFDRFLVLDRTLELQLWREATTIYMTAGHSGCGRYRLALAAHRRGFPTGFYVNGDGVLFRE